MLEFRIHGRAGQGAVTAATLLAEAASHDGKWTKAFPFFGSEKRGPPVQAYCRISDAYIESYESVTTPDVVVVLDPTLLEAVNVTDGLKPDGVVLVNTHKPVTELAGLSKAKRVVLVDATKIALEKLGKPFVNTVMLGAVAKATGAVSVDALQHALEAHFRPELAAKNVAAVKACFDAVKG